MTGADLPLGLLIKRLVLLFWAMYFSMVAITNFVDLLGEAPSCTWTFLNSGNFEYLRSVVKVYDVGRSSPMVAPRGCRAARNHRRDSLLACVELSYGRAERGEYAALWALAWGTLVWIAFVFNTEFFVAYTAEAPFRELLVIMLASILVIALVPDRPTRSET